jgi:aryl sulfotransferase
LFTHFNDLKTDLGGEMRRVARFLDIELPESKWPAVIERCTFEAMRSGDDAGMDSVFEGGRKGFIFKGTNGRWREVLDASDLSAYRQVVDARLPAEAVRFVEGGRHAVGLA